MNVGWNEGTSPCLKSLCLDAHLLSWCDWAQSSHWVSLVEGCSVLYPSHLRNCPFAYIRRLHNAAAKWLQPSPMEGEVKLLNMLTLQQFMEGLSTGKAERVCCYRPVNLELAVTLGSTADPGPTKPWFDLWLFWRQRGWRLGLWMATSHSATAGLVWVDWHGSHRAISTLCISGGCVIWWIMQHDIPKHCHCAPFWQRVWCRPSFRSSHESASRKRQWLTRAHCSCLTH